MRSLPSIASFLPLLLLLLLPIILSSADISPGSTLTPSNGSWDSQNHTFSLGFIPSVQSPSLYLAAITYAGGIPVWSAGAAAVDYSASLEFTTNGNLRLLNGSSAVVWETSTSSSAVSSAVLRDSGNLQLINSTSVVWQSFDHPTDTLVVNQNFTSGKNLTSGPYYSFTLPNTGNLTLDWNNGNGPINYYNKGLNSSFSTQKILTLPTLTLKTDGIVSLSDQSLSSSAVIAFSSNYGETGNMLRFLRLDEDGNFRAYSSLSGSGNSTVQWSAVEDQCEVYGYCGNMGICSYNYSSPVCGCPSENFMPLDPGNSRKGCRRKIELKDCVGNSTMVDLNHTQFLTYPPETSNEQFYEGGSCRLNCLSGSSCIASTNMADGSGLCHLKSSNFVSGYRSAALPSTSSIKVCAPVILNSPPSGDNPGKARWAKLSRRMVGVLVFGSIVGLAILESALWWFFCRRRANFGTTTQYALIEYASCAPVQFSYKELQRSTKGFKERLGAGGFGVVYMGALINQTPVAVKRLEGIEQGEKQFRMEVATISSTHHLNLVRLIGFCSEGRHRLLVYEFMKNGSLDGLIFSVEPSKNLSWAARFSIAIGTARGITYLHEECRDCIVHCDIKPENILLDENYNAKVSDFGLARLISIKEHMDRTLTTIRGTRGYLAPEWLADLPITSKSDVYSYGMVLLEILSGRRNFDVLEETDNKKFSLWAYKEYERGNLGSIMDKRLVGHEVNMEQLERAVQVSFWCIQEQPSQRPSMGKVVQMLEGVAEIEMPPAPKMTGGSRIVTSGFASFHALSLSGSGQATGGSSSIAGTSSSLHRVNRPPHYTL